MINGRVIISTAHSEYFEFNIIGVGKAMDHGLEFFLIGASTPGVLEETGHTYRRFYNYRSNPLLAELPNGYGRNITVTANSQAELGFRGTTGFSVWETKGFESALDIYYETVTCGLISELNDEILQGPGASGVPTSIKFSDGTTQTNLPENQTSGNVVGCDILLKSLTNETPPNFVITRLGGVYGSPMSGSTRLLNDKRRHNY